MVLKSKSIVERHMASALKVPHVLTRSSDHINCDSILTSCPLLFPHWKKTYNFSKQIRIRKLQHYNW
jgi:hypothetical protein